MSEYCSDACNTCFVQTLFLREGQTRQCNTPHYLTRDLWNNLIYHGKNGEDKKHAPNTHKNKPQIHTCLIVSTNSKQDRRGLGSNVAIRLPEMDDWVILEMEQSCYKKIIRKGRLSDLAKSGIMGGLVTFSGPFAKVDKSRQKFKSIKNICH